MSKYKLSFKSASELLKYIEEQDVHFINCNFTDLRGTWHHITQHASALSAELVENGFSFDISAIAGWQSSGCANMLAKPDLSRVSYDPFTAQKTIKVFCDVYDPDSHQPYGFDPRNVAKKAQKYLRKTDIGDVAYFGPETEFYVFDNVKVVDTANQVGYHVDSEEGSYNSGRDYPTGNMGHRPTAGEGFAPESPVDSLSDIRAEMLSVIESMGVAVEKHRHKSSPGQCELGVQYASLLGCADNVQIYKHAVRNVAHSYGKSATFMPKPVNGDNGSGMHINQSIWKNGKPLFSGDGYANLSETALFYIGGVLKHAQALNAFTNPSTNSYKRLALGPEAPALLTYSKNNPSSACSVPYSASAGQSRVEARFPDPTANPYLAFSALLMAGLDGIENKIHPGDAIDQNIYDLPEEKSPRTCVTLRQALDSLNKDQDFLLKGDVFTKELINAYIALKRKELERYEATTHPVEVEMYYSS